ncbi:arginine-tRNA-protein transferase [Infundibulicybe gibba]|nr:arginine-tRNA-protein transferase [Infundibulicybe gibba]
MAAASIGAPSGRSSSACGYCSPPEKRSSPPTSSHHAAGLSTTLLSCNVYQAMIDHGWRRSGTYCYKPDLRPSCCPNYTIRLDALAFKLSKSQRKLVNRWNRFILDGREKERMPLDIPIKHHQAPKKNRNPLPFSLSSAVHESEASSAREGQPAHRFEVVLEPPSYTDAKYALFEKYLCDIHHDSTSPDGFERFLVDSPLNAPPIPYSTSSPPSHLPIHYGSYHQLYKLDGELIAMAVLDILPHCVSSVFFMYDKTWEEFSFGKLSALREASLAREMHDAGAPGMGYLYMGSWCSV